MSSQDLAGLYPDNWPKCPGCGAPALDGHITCGRTSCPEHHFRLLREAGLPSTEAPFQSIRYFPGVCYVPRSLSLVVQVEKTARHLGLDVSGLTEREVADLLVENLIWGSNSENIRFAPTADSADDLLVPE